MHPYFNNTKVKTLLVVTCGRCEGEFQIALKKGRDFPKVVCPKCKIENRLNIVWK